MSSTEVVASSLICAGKITFFASALVLTVCDGATGGTLCLRLIGRHGVRSALLTLPVLRYNTALALGLDTVCVGVAV